jgi:glycosidase
VRADTDPVGGETYTPVMPRSMRAPVAVLAVVVALGGCGQASGPTMSPVASGPAGSAVAPTSASPAVTCVPVPDPASHDWNDRVFYEVFVRSFADSNGDGVGDLRGLIDHLDYLNDGDPATTDDLGVTGIWLMPITEAASYHGYDVVDYRAVERDFGTTDDIRDLVAEAHRRGIAVITDLVLNHTSVDNPWFQDARTPGSAHDGWYIWSDTDPGYGGPNGTQVWFPDGDRFYYAQFGRSMPDLNLANPAVTAELDAVARYWLDDIGVDGFRLDAIKHLIEDGRKQENTPATHEWLAGFHDRVRADKPGALLVGEVNDLTIASASYVPDAVDLTFDFELADRMLFAAKTGDAESLTATQADVLERYAGSQYAAFLSNHDQERTMSAVRDTGSARAAASMLLTNPGVPFVYYGEEIGLTGDKPDERIRSPMPWDGSAPAAGFSTGTPWEPLEDGWPTANVAAEAADPASLLAHYRGLVRLRGAHPALRAGTLTPLASSSSAVYAFLATRGDDRVAVIVNLGSKPAEAWDLALDAPVACGITRAEVAYTDGVTSATTVTPPSVAADGTFAGWQPVPVLPAHSTLVVALN